MGVALDSRSRDMLRHKVALWKEEVKAHDNKTLLTQRDIAELELQIAQLLMDVTALNIEYGRIVRL